VVAAIETVIGVTATVTVIEGVTAEVIAIADGRGGRGGPGGQRDPRGPRGGGGSRDRDRDKRGSSDKSRPSYSLPEDEPLWASEGPDPEFG
jgi:hypothetical protein